MHYTLRPKRVNRTRSSEHDNVSRMHTHTLTAVARIFANSHWILYFDWRTANTKVHNFVFNHAHTSLYTLCAIEHVAGWLAGWMADWPECDVACERATDRNQHKVVYGSDFICFFSFSVSLANARNDLCPLLFAVLCWWCVCVGGYECGHCESVCTKYDEMLSGRWKWATVKQIMSVCVPWQRRRRTGWQNFETDARTSLLSHLCKQTHSPK